MSLEDRMDEEACWQLLDRFPHGNLCGSTGQGTPVMRTLNHAILDGALYFHGAATGEKRGMLGRPAVFGCEEVVAQIPSYWRDPISACPATTWFQSAQVHGMLESVEDAGLKARAMSALMNRLQPEGGHLPIRVDEELYVKMLRATCVFRLVPSRLTGRNKIGQNKQPEDILAILRGLWKRGTPQDLRGMETILAGNKRASRPPELCGPRGVELIVHPSECLADQAAELLRVQYWSGPYDHGQLLQAIHGAQAWIGARDPQTGRLLGTAAAVSNGSKQAYLYDVAVDLQHQGKGIGKALTKALLDHAMVRGTRTVILRTRDAMELYRPFGFELTGGGAGPDGIVTMLRKQGAPA